jgi:hypothetical protein
MQLFGKKNQNNSGSQVGFENPGMKNSPGPAKADTVGLVPVSAIVGPFVVSKDGSFLYMLEIPPLDMGLGGNDYFAWSQRYQKALEALPPGTRFQITVLMEPVNPEDDLAFFTNKAKSWTEHAYVDSPSERETRTSSQLAASSQAMIVSLAKWYDATRPIRLRTIITLSHNPSLFQATKSAFFGNKTPVLKREDLERMLPDANEKLGQKVSILSAAFVGAGLRLEPLSPGEMCQVIWRALHPSCTGHPKDSAEDLAVSIARGGKGMRNEPPPADVFTSDLDSAELADLLAPDTFMEWEDSLEIDGVCVSGFVVHDFRPHQPAFLHRLSDLPGGWIGSMHVEVADPAVVADRLRQREVQLSANQLSRAKRGQIADFGSSQEADAVQSSRAQLEMVGQSPLYIRFFVLRTAPNKEILTARNRDLDALFSTIGVRAFPARFTQSMLWKSVIPVMRQELSQKPRNMTASSLSTFFWPDRIVFQDPDGIYIGINEDSQLPVRVDPYGTRADRTPTYLAIGRPGAGKSVWLRMMMASSMISGGRVMAVDLEGEMKKFCEVYGGRYIDVGSANGERINILDIPPDSEDPLAAGTEHLISFFEAVVGHPIPPGPDWNALAQAYRMALIDRGWIEDHGENTVVVSDWNHEDAPRLQDIVRILERQTNSVGPSLAEMLQPYASGLYARYFNAATTFDIRNERLVVFGLANVNAHDTSNLLRVYLWQVMGLIWGEVLRRNAVDKTLANHVFMDEVWALLSAPGGAAAIENMARRFRKRRAALWMATQEVGEFIGSEEGRRILSIVGNTYLMGQRPTEARRIQAVFELSDGLTDHLTHLGTGHGLLVMPENVLRIWAAVPDEWNVLI